MGAHAHKFPPSSSDRWVNCTASVPLYPVEGAEANSYMLEGSAAHLLLSEYLIAGGREGLTAAAVYRHLTTGEGAGENEYLEHMRHAMVEHVETTAEYVDTLDLEQLFVEQRVEIPVTQSFGTADVIGARGTTMHVADFKYGTGVQVNAWDNSQLKLYALGALETVGMLFDDEIDHVVLHIMQPRIDHWDHWEISRADLEAWSAGVDQAICDVRDGDGVGVFRPSELACQWCVLKTSCEAFVAHTTEEVLFAFKDAESIPERAKGLDQNLLASLLARKAELALLLGALTDEALARLAAGEKVPGWKRVEGRQGARSWTDSETVQGHLSAAQNKLDVYAPRKLVSPTQLAKAEPDLYNTVSEFVIRRPGKPTLAPASDPRPELQTMTADDFKELDENE